VDIFIWVASNLGSDGYQTFLLALPSNSETGRLNKQMDIDAIEYKHRNNLQDIIGEVNFISAALHIQVTRAIMESPKPFAPDEI
jgi:hypothetical protein